MKRQEKADRIDAQLEALYPETPVPLDHVDPFTLLVAVALSAQTTDKKVNEVTPALFAESVSTENQRLTRSTVTKLAAELLASDSKLPGLILYGPLADGDV